MLLGLILPIFIGVANVYNVTGTWFTFALAFVYIVANVGLYLFYKREHPEDFSYLKHLVIPAIGTLALLVVVYYSVNPLPAWPVGIAPFIVLGWLAIGVIVVFTVYRGNRANDLRSPGVAMGEAVEDAIEERLVAPGRCHRPEANAKVSRSGRRPRQRAARPARRGIHRGASKARQSSSPAPRRASGSGSWSGSLTRAPG